MLFFSETAELPDESWEQNPANRPTFISPDHTVHGILAQTETGLETIPVDMVFPMPHSKDGEGGTLQGLLQVAGIPFVGCSSLVSAVYMNKTITNSLFGVVGIPQTHCLQFFTNNYLTGTGEIRREIEARFGHSVFMKPANSGSSVGVSKVTHSEDLNATIRRTARENIKAVVEEAIVGQEVECAILGLSRPEASIVGETASGAEFYDYDDKYKNGAAKLFIPAHIPEETTEEMRENVLRAYHMLGCNGLARVNFPVCKSDGAVLLNELNTLSGFTSISMYPKLWEASGLSYPELPDRLIQLVFEKVYF